MFIHRLIRRFYQNEFEGEPSTGGGAPEPAAAPPTDFDLGAALTEIHSGQVDPGEPGAASTPPAEDTPPTSVEPPPPAPEPQAMPKSWEAKYAEKWATLDPEVKAEILRREDNFHTGLEGYKADAQVARSFKAAVQPYMPALQQAGIDPVALASNLVQAHYTLSTAAPDQRINLFRQIASDYGIDLANLAGQEAPFVDPQVRTLQDELSALKSQLTGITQQSLQEKRASLEAEVNTFAADPKHDLFPQVVDDVASLIRTDRQMTLAQAYEKAVWANPTTRATMLERQQKAATEAAAQTAKAHAAKAAKAAGSTVRPAARSANVTVPPGSMEETLSASLAEIKARG